MADIYESLYTYLLTQSGLTALISTRIYPEERPQGSSLPAVVYLTVSDVKDHLYGAQDSLEHPNIQFTVYASSKPSARLVADQIKTALCEYSGTLSGMDVQYILMINELPGLERSPDGTTVFYTHDLEFEVNFNKE